MTTLQRRAAAIGASFHRLRASGVVHAPVETPTTTLNAVLARRPRPNRFHWVALRRLLGVEGHRLGETAERPRRHWRPMAVVVAAGNISIVRRRLWRRHRPVETAVVGYVETLQDVALDRFNAVGLPDKVRTAGNFGPRLVGLR